MLQQNIQVHERIAQGLRSAVDRHWRYTKNLLMIKPEYLLTVSVADALTDGFDGINGLDLLIKLEEPTRFVSLNLQKSAVGWGGYFKQPRHKVTRRGKVDIFVEHELDQGCWIVELKGFNPSGKEIDKDLKRLAEFLSANDGNHRCRGAFLAFPSLADRRLCLQRRVARCVGVTAVVHSGWETTNEDPQDGISGYYTNCIALQVDSKSPAVTATVGLAD